MTRGDVDLRDDVRTTRAASTPEPTVHRRPETKTFIATSEFWVAVGAVVALFIGGYALNDITNATAWKYATWVAIAYIVSRGVAKAGSQRDYEYVRRARDRVDMTP